MDYNIQIYAIIVVATVVFGFTNVCGGLTELLLGQRSATADLAEIRT
jgi:hypothetical protein